MDANQKTVVDDIIAGKKIAVFPQNVQDLLGIMLRELQLEFIIEGILVFHGYSRVPV